MTQSRRLPIGDHFFADCRLEDRNRKNPLNPESGASEQRMLSAPCFADRGPYLNWLGHLHEAPAHTVPQAPAVRIELGDDLRGRGPHDCVGLHVQRRGLHRGEGCQLLVDFGPGQMAGVLATAHVHRLSRPADLLNVSDGTTTATTSTPSIPREASRPPKARWR